MRSLVTFFLIATLGHRIASRHIDAGDYKHSESSRNQKRSKIKRIGKRRIKYGCSSKHAKSGICTVHCVHAIQNDFLPLTNLTKLFTMYRNMMQSE